RTKTYGTTTRRAVALRPPEEETTCFVWTTIRIVAFGQSGMTRISSLWSYTRKGPPSFCGDSKRTRHHPPLLEPLCQQRPPLPCALESAGPRPSMHAAWLRDHTRPGPPRHTAGVRPCRESGVPLNEADAWCILPGRGPT